MPYIVKEQRQALDGSIKQLSDIMKNAKDDSQKGVLNYVITKLILNLLEGNTRYNNINNIVGALECCKIEFYRRLAAPYEDTAVERNGDVYVTNKQN